MPHLIDQCAGGKPGKGSRGRVGIVPEKGQPVHPGERGEWAPAPRRFGDGLADFRGHGQALQQGVMAGASQQVGENSPSGMASLATRTVPAGGVACRQRLGFQHHFRGHAQRHEENHLAEFHNPPLGLKKQFLWLRRPFHQRASVAASKASQPPLAAGKQTSGPDPYESGLLGQSGYLPVTHFGHRRLWMV